MSTQRMLFRMVVSTLALVMAGLMGAPTMGSAQTEGSERREERRGVRQDARDAKDECKDGDEKSRAECRQQKRDTKQDARQGTGEVKPPEVAAPPQ